MSFFDYTFEHSSIAHDVQEPAIDALAHSSNNITGPTVFDAFRSSTWFEMGHNGKND